MMAFFSHLCMASDWSDEITILNDTPITYSSIGCCDDLNNIGPVITIEPAQRITVPYCSRLEFLDMNHVWNAKIKVIHIEPNQSGQFIRMSELDWEDMF